MLAAKDIMTTNVLSVQRNMGVRELAKFFADNRISSAPVVDDNGDLIGFITESDLIEQDRSLHLPTVISLFDWVIYLESAKKFERDLQKMTGQSVGDICAENVTVITPETLLSEIADIMSNLKYHALPVVVGRKVVGIVARIDLIRTLINQD